MNDVDIHAYVQRAVVALERIAAAIPMPADAATPAPGRCPVCGASEAKQVDAGNIGSPGLKKCLICQTEYV